MVTKTNLSISHKGWENLKAQTGGTFLTKGWGCLFVDSALYFLIQLN